MKLHTTSALLIFVCAGLLLAFPAFAQDVTEEQPIDYGKYEFELREADGIAAVSFASLAAEGKPFAIVWWLTDCPLCRMSMPYVQKLENLRREGGMEFNLVTIAIDWETEPIEEYIAQRQLTFTVLHDGRARRTDEGYNIRELGTPLVYVFDAEGTELGLIEGFSSSMPWEVLKMMGFDVEEE